MDYLKVNDSPETTAASSCIIRSHSVDLRNQDSSGSSTYPRPRCYTDPGWSRHLPSPVQQHPGALNSLLRQTLNVTSASVGISARRRSPLRHSARLSDDARFKDIRVNMARKGSENNPRSSVKSATTSKMPPSPSVESLTKSKSELDLVKNKSNLYLIKSYSFIDKTSKSSSCNKINNGKHSEETDFEEIRQLLMYDSKKSSKVKPKSAKSGTESDCDESLLRKKSGGGGSGKMRRPKSLPVSGNVKRESFLRQSFQSIRRSFTKKPASINSGSVMSSSSSGGSERTHFESDFEGEEMNGSGGAKTRSTLGELKEEDETRISRSTSVRTMAELERSTSSVSTLSHSAPGSPMAPLQGHSETQSVNCLNTIGKNSSPFKPQPISSSTIPATIASKADNKSLRQSTSTPFPSVSSSANLSSQSPSSKVTIVAKNEIPEKEKKRKELSSSRLKKFHRHFQQVSKDERVINYFSCALVSDILLQGHLYITDNHFAFYSNVFGYVTKVVIPTSSVTKISKEKTAKIIPNAVGVATADERHVFGSFISRESAFRLMCSVCPPLAPIQLIPKALPDVEISEECSIEDDSSCSISGNESPPQPIESGATTTTTTTSDASQTLLRRTNKTDDGKGDLVDKRHSDPLNAKNTLLTTGGIRASAPPKTLSTNNSTSPTASKQQTQSSSTTSTTSANVSTNSTTLPAAAIVVGNVVVGVSSSFTSTSSTSSASSVVTGQTSSSSSSSPNTVVSSSSTAFKAFSQSAIVRLKFPTEFHIVYLGVVLSIILAIFSGFLLYRILDIEAKTSLYRSPVEFNWGSGNDADIFAEALRWQKELQTKSTEEAQNILHTNLQQIAKVRRSLETLSMLIHDRSSSSSSAYEAEGGVDRDDTD